MNPKKIAVLPGDGIGPEVMEEAIKVLDALSDKYLLIFNYKYTDVGGIAYDRYGTALPVKKKLTRRRWGNWLPGT